MYQWDFDGLARQEFDALSAVGQAAITAFMNAAVLVDQSSISATLESHLTRPSYCGPYISVDITKD